MDVYSEGTNNIIVEESRPNYYRFKLLYQAWVQANPNSRAVLRSEPISSGNTDWCLLYKTTNFECNCREIDIYCDVSLEIVIVSNDADDGKNFKLSLLDKTGKKIMSAYRRTDDNISLTTNQYMVEDLAVVDGWFYVECKISETYSEKVDSLPDQLGNLLKNRDNTDAIIEVNGELFHVHRSILGARSPFFKRLLFGPMTESQSGLARIEDMDREVFRHLLHYIYTDTLDPDPEIISVNMAQHLFVAADRYCLDGLKRMCEEILCNAMSLSSVLSSFSLAVTHNGDKLRRTSAKFASDAMHFDQLVSSDEYKELNKNCPDHVALLCKEAGFAWVA